MIHDNLTLVTALFDIGRENLSESFRRSYEHYLECFSVLLKIPLPMVIFCDERTEEFVFKHRSADNTKIVRKTLEDIRAFPFFNQIQKIRKHPQWINQSGWLADSPQAALEMYNPVVMSKQFFLNDASIYNTFNTKYFAWIDAGLSNTVNIGNYLTSKAFVNKLLRKMDKMLYIAFPYDGNVEVHGFKKSAMDSFAKQQTKYVVRGGFFGGTRDSIADVNAKYYALLNDTLNSGYMGTEESLFTILSYREPSNYNLHMINSNGLLYKFFDDVKSEKFDIKIHGDGTLAIYALTYNLPKQFDMWAQSFLAAYPKEFSYCRKYVLNNSTDDKVDKEYKKLFKQYNFEELKYDNIGINDARYQIAKHFDSSDHEFMIFFEDDMLLHGKDDIKSKLGFCTHYQNAFDVCMDIARRENLDYLKLSFDEFFGNNLENWGWYNVPENTRLKLFPDNDKRTKINHLGSYKGVPYAVGEFHYCNWPILFTKHGNRKVFLDTEYEYKYEQTWMSLVCSLQKDNKILSGSLLASLINHNRVYHYPKEDRKENNK